MADDERTIICIAVSCSGNPNPAWPCYREPRKDDFEVACNRLFAFPHSTKALPVFPPQATFFLFVLSSKEDHLMALFPNQLPLPLLSFPYVPDAPYPLEP